MLDFILDCMGSLLTSAYVDFVFIPVISLAILASIPCIIRSLVRWR